MPSVARPPSDCRRSTPSRRSSASSVSSLCPFIAPPDPEAGPERQPTETRVTRPPARHQARTSREGGHGTEPSLGSGHRHPLRGPKEAIGPAVPLDPSTVFLQALLKRKRPLQHPLNDAAARLPEEESGPDTLGRQGETLAGGVSHDEDLPSGGPSQPARKETCRGTRWAPRSGHQRSVEAAH